MGPAREGETSRLVVAVGVVLAISAAAITYGILRSDPSPRQTRSLREGDQQPNSEKTRRGPDRPAEELEGPNLRAACDLPFRWVRALYRGWDAGGARDFDLALVPHPPNYMGSVTDTSHSGPYDFLQKVPLVFYGPNHISRRGPVRIEREVTLADVAPTAAATMGFDFPARAGKPLNEILREGADPPRLIVTAVIDGGGWNVLRRWPNSWPRLEELMQQGASIEGATVGSSPSITPATHTNLSTGLFPNRHGVTAIVVRTDRGELTESFTPVGETIGVATMDARASLRTTTLGDLWDLENDNEALIGMVAPGFLQLGMVGRGSALEGADKDTVAVLSKKRLDWETNPEFYSLPDYVNTDVRGPRKDKEAVDRADGSVDGQWRGHDISPVYASPALAPWENRTIQALIEREGFGKDEVTDLFYINYKAPDAAGHIYNMIAPEQADTLESVDTAIGDLTDWLDKEIGTGEYVLIVTADHGQTPLEAGGWPIRPLEIIDDLNEAFDRASNDRGVIEDTSAHTLFMNRTELRTNGVTPEEVADFLYDYRIGDNVSEADPFPPEFAGREGERIFDSVIPGRLLDDVYTCVRRA